ncbi:MAG: ABC transporter ATP-binding protein [Clostridia bacterium]|nr:ABC transporter ATP-binding protein [Clostridia bacterium]
MSENEKINGAEQREANKKSKRIDFRILGRIIKLLFKHYPGLTVLTLIFIMFSAVVSSIPSLFLQRVIETIGKFYDSQDWAAAKQVIIPQITLLICLYSASVICILVFRQLSAYITQGLLYKLRRQMFDNMQNLPIRYFDRNSYGDIMSYYTNDIDAIRQVVSETLPVVLQSGVIVLTVLIIMAYFSVWLMLLVLLGVGVMLFVSKTVGGNSSKYFVRQQKAMGKTEGYIQEMMNGQKVVKVFCHEEQSGRDFDKVNNALFEDSFRAHTFANMLGPIIMNLGNILYVLVAVVGGILMINNVPNVSLSGIAMGISIVIPFLNMTKQFTGNLNQLSQQINYIAMALAGAQRVFALTDEAPETDNGYVTLVNAVIDDEGNVTESDVKTGQWAWKHPHGDGTLTYTPLKGDVRMFDVDFGYDEGKTVLHDISLYAEPGQKVAFVGATGAGKTTITNLLNRFYDIADGKIRYDGININKIKKSDLRRSLGLVLQETSLFTGTVMDNIRYGRLDATDEECIAAAKLAGADSFITRLPEGYKTQLSGSGSNLSQGQRQLLAIARAAVADPPVMILDEATSSIDTRTESIVQQGMDKLMEGRTVFVIAHRLSTVMNSDVIMVLDHGRIIERGNHDQLIAQKGTYYQLYTGAFELE